MALRAETEFENLSAASVHSRTRRNFSSHSIFELAKRGEPNVNPSGRLSRVIEPPVVAKASHGLVRQRPDLTFLGAWVGPLWAPGPSVEPQLKDARREG